MATMLNPGLLSRISLIGQGRTVANKLRNTPGVKQLPAAGLDIFVAPDFLSAEECEAVIERSDRTLQPSAVLGPTADPDYRTSRSGNLDRNDPFVLELDSRIAHFLGLEPKFGETIQGQRYDATQQFKAHWDYFHEDQPYWESQRIIGGQRSWTAMIYLAEPEAGGATDFEQVGISVAPRRGLLLAWNNMDANGEPNAKAKHQGSPVTAGTKYIITKWFRERPWGVYYDPQNPSRTDFSAAYRG